MGLRTPDVHVHVHHLALAIHEKVNVQAECAAVGERFVATGERFAAGRGESISCLERESEEKSDGEEQTGKERAGKAGLANSVFKGLKSYSNGTGAPFSWQSWGATQDDPDLGPTAWLT